LEQIGYSLIDASGNEVQAFGDTKGLLYSPPEMIELPNGDQVHAASVGEQLGEWRFVERWLSDSPPGPLYASTGRSVSFDGTKIIVTVTYESTPSIPAPVTTPFIPPAVSPAQARLALLNAGLLDQANAAVTAAGGATQITWEYATVIMRTDPLIENLGAALNLTSAQIDQLFIQAATISL
jgi:hypothetical protein